MNRRTRRSILSAMLAGTVIAVVQALIWPPSVTAHGGGLDANGCHNDRQRGGYHCHRGPLAGQSFSSSADAAAAMRGRSAPAAPQERPAPPSTQALGLVTSNPSPPRSELSGVFDSFNRQTRVLVIKDAIGTTFQFAVRDDTEIGPARERADDYLELNPSSIPWKIGQSLVVEWRPSADRQRRVAQSVR